MAHRRPILGTNRLRGEPLRKRLKDDHPLPNKTRMVATALRSVSRGIQTGKKGKGVKEWGQKKAGGGSHTKAKTGKAVFREKEKKVISSRGIRWLNGEKRTTGFQYRGGGEGPGGQRRVGVGA